jgi:hypothetical protein
MRRLFAPLLFLSCLTLLAACGDDKDSSCTTDSQCGGALICAHLSICGPEGCPGTCSTACDTQDQCGSDELCVDEPGSRRGYCRHDVPRGGSPGVDAGS